MIRKRKKYDDPYPTLKVMKRNQRWSTRIKEGATRYLIIIIIAGAGVTIFNLNRVKGTTDKNLG